MTITSVSVINPTQSNAQIVSVETDYDLYPNTNLNPIQMDFKPNLEDNTFIIITLQKSSSNVVLPKTIQLAVYGCGEPVYRYTKAQIEQRKNSK